MRFVFLLFTFGWFLLACTQPPAAPPDPLAPLVVQFRDLPDRYHTRQELLPSTLYPGLPKPSASYYYEIILGANESNEVGHITVARYADSVSADAAYAAILKEATFEKPSEALDFAEQGVLSRSSDNWPDNDIVFRLCDTVVHTSLEYGSLPSLTAYTQKLHDRLKPVVCADQP